jgi:serine/threonine-protein kinase
MPRTAEPQARLCLVCQAPLPDDAQFCHRCGTGTPTDPGVPPRTASTGVQEVDSVRSALAGRYRIERLLGEGGMAAVYLAEDLKHRREVAVKVMRPELVATLGTDRFLREIEIAAKLTHPHILPLLDSGAVETKSSTVLYYVMPYVNGETVRELLDRETQLPVGDAVRLAREVAEGLAYAHERGIVHRDIKPANILISGRHALVADFGIARAIGEDGESLTRTGLSVGTPHYMAPEQSAGDREVDHRADIYSVGALLYEMLVGEPPFTGPNARAVIMRSVTERPRPVSDARDGVPPALEAAVMRALSKSPADRPQTAAEFAAELERAMDVARTPAAGMPAAVLPPEPAPSPIVTWGLFAVGSLAGLAVAYAAVRHWAMPVWVTWLAVGLVLIGAGVMLATTLMERRRQQGLPTPVLARGLTWRNAATGGFLALGLWALVAAALVIRGPGGSGRDGAIRLAVMPFENRGAAEDAYFVDGVADEVRGKLSQLSGFEVIARGSTDQFGETGKSPTQIGAELGVDYLLAGTVRRARGTDSAGRVQVTAEVMDVRTGTVRWQERFDRADGEVLAVQSAIAARVAAALGVALSGSDAADVEERPTENVAAYDLYLKGRAAGYASVPREAVGYFEQAVALDAGFKQAWRLLVSGLTLVYANGDRDPAIARRAREALDRLAQLDPSGSEYHAAAGAYYGNVERDLNRAALHADSALQISPGDPAVIARAGSMDVALGRTASGIERLERARALDPLSAPILRSLQNALFTMRRFAETREAAEALAARGEMSVGDWQQYTLAYVADGDVAGARAVVQRALQDVPPTELVARFAGVNETAWLLNEPEQQLLLRLPVSAFEDDQAWWAQSLATAHWVRGDRAAARAYADSGLAISRDQADRASQDAQLRVLYAVLLAYAGQGEAARTEGRRAVELNSAQSTTAQGTAYIDLQLARIHLALNQPDSAVGYLERAANKTFYTPAYLRAEPAFQSLHGNARFERLVAGS